MSSIFDQYNDEFAAKTQKISNLISHVTSYETNPVKKMVLLREAEKLLAEAGEDLKLMGIEARGTRDPSVKEELTGKMSSYKRTLTSLRGDYQQTLDREEREGLLGGSGEHRFSQGGHIQEQRDRLLKTTDRLDEQTQRIQDSRRTVLEIEEVAMEITSELGRNREKITGVHDKVREVSGMTASARRLVHSMNKREVQQKFVLYGIALLLVVGVCVAVYLAVQ
ncbi:unnamed protein product [Choristocarpus tenellus]